MTEHTPGPWLLGSEQSRDEYALCINRKTLSARIDSIARACPMDSPEEAEANARLIATAPDLLAALEAAADHIADLHSEVIDQGHRLHRKEQAVLDNARAAIAKARQ